MPSAADPQASVVSHAKGTLLVTGIAGSGRTESLARRLAGLAGKGEQTLALTSSHATAGHLRTRAEEAATEAFEELAVHPHRVAAVRLLREHSTEAGVDPFLEALSAAERLAVLLDRVDDLPLRRHEIRGNPAGLLARVIRRIDALKAAAVGAERFRGWADELTRQAGDEAERDSAEREREFAELYAIHDSLLFEAGATDGGSAILELTRLLGERPALATAISERYPHLIVDELEDACPAERELVARLAKGSRTAVLSCDDDQGRARCGAGAEWARTALDPDEVRLDTSWRYGGDLLDAAHAVLAPVAGRGDDGPRRTDGPTTEIAFWSAVNSRAEDQAVAREIEGCPRRRRRRGGPGVRRRAAGRRALARHRRRARGAPRPAQAHLGRRVLPAPRGARRDRLAAAARRSDRRRGGREGAEPRSGRAALGGPRAVHHDRAPPQAGHDLGARGVAREPADPSRGPRQDPLVPDPARRRGPGDGRAADRRLRPAADRAGRLPAPAPVRSPSRGGRAAAEPLAPGRPRRGLDPPRAAGLEPRLHPLSGRRLRGGRVARGRAGRAGRRRGPRDPLRRAEGRRVRPRLRRRAAGRGRAGRGSDRRPRRADEARRRRRGPSGPPAAPALHRDDARPHQARALAAGLDRRGPRGGFALLRGGARGDRRRRDRAARGALRPRRGPARDLPDGPGRRPGGGVARRRDAGRAAARHLPGREPRGHPLPGAAEAERADTAARRRADLGRAARDQRPSRPGRPRSSSARPSPPRRWTTTCSTPRASSSAGPS